MTGQLNIGGLIAALELLPDSRMPLIIGGFGAANIPAQMGPHRTGCDGLAIDGALQRMSSMTVERFVAVLRRQVQNYSRSAEHPPTLDTPVWVRPGTEHHPEELSFHAVTGVDIVRGRAVLRSTDLAPLQGPALRRITDEEALRRIHETDDWPNPHAGEKKSRWLLEVLPGDRAAARVRLEETRNRIEALRRQLPGMEADLARADYILGITDTAPGRP